MYLKDIIRGEMIMNTTENTKEIEEELLVNDLEDMSYSVNNYLIYG